MGELDGEGGGGSGMREKEKSGGGEKGRGRVRGSSLFSVSKINYFYVLRPVKSLSLC